MQRKREKEVDLLKFLKKTRGENGDHNKHCILIVQPQTVAMMKVTQVPAPPRPATTQD